MRTPSFVTTIPPPLSALFTAPISPCSSPFLGSSRFLTLLSEHGLDSLEMAKHCQAMLSHLWGCGCGSRRGTWTHWTQRDLEVHLETVWSSFVNDTESIIQTRLPRLMVVIAVVVVVAVGVRKGKEIELRGISDLQGNLVNQRRHFDAKSIILGRGEHERKQRMVW
jgi:hypothetical protein